jgi:uncharacterized protein (DUF4213/DUF364 family)
MKILHELLETLPVEPIQVRDIVIGVHWTMVCSKYAGLGSTIVETGPHGHSPVTSVGELHQKSAQDLARFILSDSLLEASIGIAALNSIIEIDESKIVQVNASDILASESEGKNLAVVGHFPFVDSMKAICRNCWVIEKKPYGEDFPEEAASEYIPRADVVAITGTAFINHTIETLLSLCQPCAKIMILGPSTPMLPLLFDHNVTFLSGSRVIDEEAARITIQQGAIFKQVKGVRLISMKHNERNPE